MKLDSLEKLFIETLQDLYDAEHQITKALPMMRDSASAPDLKNAFDRHLRQTEMQIQRLEQVFESVNQRAKRKACKGMQGLIEEGSEMMKQNDDMDVRDAGLIAAAQKVEHYEVAGYGTARTYADLLGFEEAATLLQTTLDEEWETDELLTELAESNINVEAMD